MCHDIVSGATRCSIERSNSFTIYPSNPWRSGPDSHACLTTAVCVPDCWYASCSESRLPSPCQVGEVAVGVEVPWVHRVRRVSALARQISSSDFHRSISSAAGVACQTAGFGFHMEV